MRSLAILRLAAILLAAAVPLASPTFAGTAPVALADNGKPTHSNHGNGHEDSDDGNHGHGNDPDGVDEDNPGNGEGKTERKGEEKPVETVPVAGYTVAVDCQLGTDPGTTACEIAATAPEGGKRVTFLQLPAEALCADVVETDATFADPDPKTHVTGYASHGSDASLEIILDGGVKPSSTATYMIGAGGNVFPVEGPGLICNGAVASAATEAPATGTVVVETLTCAGVPADTAGFDWFGECQPGADPARVFTLTPSDDSAPPVAATTDETGEATFTAVAPGNYRLDLVDGSWCHANADRVTAESEVVVDPGATSTVWIFACETTAGAKKAAE